MSTNDSSGIAAKPQIRGTYEVSAPPNDLSAGFVLCEAYHRKDGHFDPEAKLYISKRGALSLMTSRGVFPVKGHYSPSRAKAVVIESDQTIVVNNPPLEPLFETELVEIAVPRAAWNMACHYAELVVLYATFGCAEPFPFPYTQEEAPDAIISAGILNPPKPLPPAPPMPVAEVR